MVQLDVVDVQSRWKIESRRDFLHFSEDRDGNVTHGQGFRNAETIL